MAKALISGAVQVGVGITTVFTNPRAQCQPATGTVESVASCNAIVTNMPPRLVSVKVRNTASQDWPSANGSCEYHIFIHVSSQFYTCSSLFTNKKDQNFFPKRTSSKVPKRGFSAISPGCLDPVFQAPASGALQLLKALKPDRGNGGAVGHVECNGCSKGRGTVGHVEVVEAHAWPSSTQLLGFGQQFCVTIPRCLTQNP